MPAMTFTVTQTEQPTSPERRAEILANPGFGKFHTDHMVLIDWTEEQGWHDARVVPYQPFVLDLSGLMRRPLVVTKVMNPRSYAMQMMSLNFGCSVGSPPVMVAIV